MSVKLTVIINPKSTGTYDPAAVTQKLKAGKDVAISSPDFLSMKKRKHLLNSIPQNLDVYKACIIYVSPIFGDDPALKNFCPPGIYEGFDLIMFSVSSDEFSVSFLDEKRLSLFSQESKWHSLSLGDHMKKAEEYAKLHNFPDAATVAASIHDIGKLYTKSWDEEKETSHFYGHENVGAWLALEAYAWELQNGVADAFTWNEWLYVSQLIFWHMRPHNEWKRSPKCFERESGMLGTEMVRDIMLLHEADTNAK